MGEAIRRGGGKAGRPMGTWSIDMLEKHVRANKADDDELQLVMAELGYRRTQRAMELKALVSRLIDDRTLSTAKNKAKTVGPLFD